MSSCKSGFLGVFATGLLIAGLLASPMQLNNDAREIAIDNKEEHAVLTPSGLAGGMITKTADSRIEAPVQVPLTEKLENGRVSLLGIDGGTLNKTSDEVLTPRVEEVLSPLAIGGSDATSNTELHHPIVANGSRDYVGSWEFTYDWYCSGSPGSSPLEVFEDGTVDIGGYGGTWYSDGGSVTYDAGLCPGATLDADFFFTFDNYDTWYTYDFSDLENGAGWHDDRGYNGENIDGETFITAAGGGGGGGDCPDGTIADCSDDDCCPESYVGDGWCDGEDQAWGCDLCCYDNDGGDCTDDECSGGGGGGDECPDGYSLDCSDEDCCPDSWIGDGLCDGEDQAWGCDLCCYDCDGGDCNDTGQCADCGGGGGGGDCEVVSEHEFTYDWYCSGSPGSSPLTLCADGTCDIGGYTGTWGADAGQIDLGAGLCPAWSADVGLWFTFDNYDTYYYYELNDDGTGQGKHDDAAYNGQNADGDTVLDGGDGGGGGGDCPDGTIEDCSDDDCCPESYVGDGWCDGEDQAWGCDLCCYDNDGGDCTDDECGGGGGGGDCDDGYSQDCVDEDCCPDSWIGDGLCDGEDQAWGCNLCCYDCDGGDCGADQCSDCDGGGGGGDCEVVAEHEFTYDWYCSGSPGSSPLTLCADGTCDIGGYTGTWGADAGQMDLGAGLCPAASLDVGLWFTFDNYDTYYYYELSDDGTGAGWHDDVAYNGQNVDGETLLDGGDGGGGGEDCPDGYSLDCSDEDCCPDSWIGDGLCDGEDQAWGCDLCCYDCDGGDCAEDQCSDCGDGGGGGGNCDDGSCVEFEFTYDWYCSGSPGSSPLTLFSDGTCDIGGYTGTWSESAGMDLGAGLCPAASTGAGFTFTFDNYDTNYTYTQDGGLCSDGAGWHDDVAYNGENVDGETFATFISGDCEDADPCDGQALGDVNNDGTINVLDVVSTVNYILAGGDGLDDCGEASADYNQDGTVNVLDVVSIVNLILSGGGRAADADSATVIISENDVTVEADGYVGAVQMSLSHGSDFALELTDNAFVAKSRTEGNTTNLMIVVPDGEALFTYTGDFNVEELIVVNSEEYVDATLTNSTMPEFSLSAAYPNPFNPTTTVELNIKTDADASVKVYNLKGEVVGVLMNGMVEANTYTMTWDASNLSSGVYMIKAESNGQVATQKVMLLK